MKPKLFLVLSWVAFIIFLLLLVTLNYLIYPRLHTITKELPILFFILSALAVLIIGGGLLLLTLTTITKMDLLYPHGKKQITVRVLLPIVTLLGKILQIHPDKIRLSYIALNNTLILATKKRIKTNSLLLLLPHCLQWSECPQRITRNITDCKKCGKCVIGELNSKYLNKFTKIAVATGGSIARKIVVDTRPDLIIAVACERDLLSGINDAYPIPTYGITNKRPYGPCFNTQLDLKELEEALELFGENNKT